MNIDMYYTEEDLAEMARRTVEAGIRKCGTNYWFPRSEDGVLEDSFSTWLREHGYEKVTKVLKV